MKFNLNFLIFINLINNFLLIIHNFFSINLINNLKNFFHFVMKLYQYFFLNVLFYYSDFS